MKGSQQGERPSWYALLQQGPGVDGTFTRERRRQVLTMAASQRQEVAGKRKRLMIGVMSAAIALIVAGGAFWVYLESIKVHTLEKVIEGGLPIYLVDEQEQVQAFVGGEGAVAGEAAGCWWNFDVPYTELEGKTVSILATHVESGLEQVELRDTVITQAHRYNEELTRVSSAFALPIAGQWIFEVRVDGKPLEKIMRRVSEGAWVVDGTFQSGSYEMTGKADALGFINPGFVAGKTNKYMWHFWGTAEELTGKMEIRAIRQGDNEVVDVYSSPLQVNSHNGADTAVPTGMMLPERGIWKLIVHVDDGWIGNVIVEVV